MVASIKYTDGDARSYKAVELHTRTDHHTFDSGDFPTDWFGMLKFVTSLPDDSDEYDGLMFSSSVFHFFYFDGGDELYERGLLVTKGDYWEILYDWDPETQDGGITVYTNKGEFLTHPQYKDKYSIKNNK